MILPRLLMCRLRWTRLPMHGDHRPPMVIQEFRIEWRVLPAHNRFAEHSIKLLNIELLPGIAVASVIV